MFILSRSPEIWTRWGGAWHTQRAFKWCEHGNQGLRCKLIPMFLKFKRLLRHKSNLAKKDSVYHPQYKRCLMAILTKASTNSLDLAANVTWGNSDNWGIYMRVCVKVREQRECVVAIQCPWFFNMFKNFHKTLEETHQQSASSICHSTCPARCPWWEGCELIIKHRHLKISQSSGKHPISSAITSADTHFPPSSLQGEMFRKLTFLDTSLLSQVIKILGCKCLLFLNGAQTSFYQTCNTEF